MIASYITAEKRYGYDSLPVFMLARDGKLIADDGNPKWAAAKLVGFDGAYLRFAGELRIEHYKGEQLVESQANDALWELMYFGKARP